jgi:hypothetical protein
VAVALKNGRDIGRPMWGWLIGANFHTPIFGRGDEKISWVLPGSSWNDTARGRLPLATIYIVTIRINSCREGRRRAFEDP